MEIEYKTGILPSTAEIINVYNSSGIRRPTDDSQRITKMYENSNLIISAWAGEELVGIARCLTDFCYACYLSDLAVDINYQKSGIGRELIHRVKLHIGKQTALILLSAPNAMDYYPKVGFSAIENGFIIRREM